MITMNFLILLLGLVFLVKGSDYFVKAASTIAKKLGVSEFVIGLTLVAVGTSIPELASSIVASIQQASGIVIGNIVGSNIVNIGLIVGVAAFLSPMKTEVEMLKRDGYIMLFAAVLFFVFALNGELSMIESGIFVLLYVAYVFFLFEEAEKYEGKLHFKEFITYFFKFKYINSAVQKINGNRNRGSESGNENGRLEGGFSKRYPYPRVKLCSNCDWSKVFCGRINLLCRTFRGSGYHHRHNSGCSRDFPSGTCGNGICSKEGLRKHSPW